MIQERNIFERGPYPRCTSCKNIVENAFYHINEDNNCELARNIRDFLANFLLPEYLKMLLNLLEIMSNFNITDNQKLNQIIFTIRDFLSKTKNQMSIRYMLDLYKEIPPKGGYMERQEFLNQIENLLYIHCQEENTIPDHEVTLKITPEGFSISYYCQNNNVDYQQADFDLNNEEISLHCPQCNTDIKVKPDYEELFERLGKHPLIAYEKRFWDFVELFSSENLNIEEFLQQKHEDITECFNKLKNSLSNQSTYIEILKQLTEKELSEYLSKLHLILLKDPYNLNQEIAFLKNLNEEAKSLMRETNQLLKLYCCLSCLEFNILLNTQKLKLPRLDSNRLIRARIAPQGSETRIKDLIDIVIVYNTILTKCSQNHYLLRLV